MTAVHPRSGTWRGHPCFYCGAPAEGRDHKVPVARGGSLFACVACNSRKGNRTVEEYRLDRAIRAGRLPYRFAGEPSAPSQRDVLAVASPSFLARLVAHNGRP